MKTKGALMRVKPKAYWVELATDQAETIKRQEQEIQRLKEQLEGYVKDTDEYKECLKRTEAAEAEAERWHRKADADFERAQAIAAAYSDVVPAAAYQKALADASEAKQEAYRWRSLYEIQLNGQPAPLKPPKLPRGRQLAVGTKERAREIWTEYVHGASYSVLAEKYNVSKTTIMRIVRAHEGIGNVERYV